MAIKLHEAGFRYAQELIERGLEVERTAKSWQAHQPTQDEVVKFLETHYMSEYGLWFLGIDTEVPKENKEHYVYPHGDLKIVHKDALLETKERAQQAGHEEIAKAACTLLELIDGTKES